jgi:signal transduction histidine kinase
MVRSTPLKLKYRLFLLFFVTIAMASVTSLILVRRSTEQLFRSFVFFGDAQKANAYASILSEYYTASGNWNKVQEFLLDLPSLLSATIDSKIYGENHWTSLITTPTSTLRSLLEDRIVVADIRGLIVADTAKALVGTIHPERHLQHGVPVYSNFGQIGTVLVGSMIDSSLTGMDEQYLRSVTEGIAWSTAVAALIALFAGLFFASRITHPLMVLAKAARSVARGKLAEPVPVVGKDEIADLSASFNDMVTELKKLEAAKKQVIADSAHELRTPVTLIQGIVEGMIDGVFPRDDKTLASVYEETKRLSKLIDTLRELQIIESGELHLSPEGVDLKEVTLRAIGLFKPQAAKKKIDLRVEMEAAATALVRGDYLRIEEVLYNLLSNALAYTPEGGVIRVGVAQGPGTMMSIYVDDSGPGIPPEERVHIFERFYRLDKSRSTNSGGRGLGLAITSEIIKAHGGSIQVEHSDLGGARFIILLPRHIS